jgi:hypothetical protein
MSLEVLLAQRKNEIIKDWFDRVVETYPADTSTFLKSRKDPFANPVGSTTLQSLKSLYGELLKGLDEKAVIPLLDPVIRIRAIQDFTPSQAVGFIFSLKRAIRHILNKELDRNRFENELRLFEEQIDALSLIAFNIFVTCREKIYQLKANEVKNRTFRAFERAGLVCERPEIEPEFRKFNP